MAQFRGLLKKDWTLVKGYVLLALVLDLLIPFTITALYSMELWEGVLVFAGAVMGLHLLVPLILLSILFTKEMDRPDVFFHSTASIHKLNASKFLIAVFGTLLSLVWVSIIALAALWMAPEQSGISEVLSTGAVFSLSILIFSIVTAVVFYFFMTLFFSMKPKIGGFAYIVTIGLFFISLEIWNRIQQTALYEKITGFWKVDISESDLLLNFSKSVGSFNMSVETLPELPIGQLLVTFVLLALLYLLSAYWFEKKVRV